MIRGVSADRTYGYGVDGILMPTTDLETIVAVENYIADIPFAGDQSGERNVFAIVSMRWRFKLQIIIEDADIPKIFNNRNGRGMYGEIWYSYLQYFSGFSFVQFPTFISPLFTHMVAVELGSNPEEVLPCDEPPQNLGFVLRNDMSVDAVTNLFGAGFGGFSLPEPGQIGDIIASSCGYYPPNESTPYIYGATYSYRVRYFTQEQRDNADPIHIGL